MFNTMLRCSSTRQSNEVSFCIARKCSKQDLRRSDMKIKNRKKKKNTRQKHTITNICIMHDNDVSQYRQRVIRFLF